MKRNDSSKMYAIETYIAEIYDQIENHDYDVRLIRSHIGNKKMRILEPFCGTGRISLPLAIDGHEIVGIDNAKGMLDWFDMKIEKSNINQQNIELIEGNVLTDDWPTGFDLVILGGNCFYELASKSEQEMCIEKAHSSLNPGGYIYVDNDHMEGDLDLNWQEKGVTRKSLCGTTKDGTVVETTRKTIWYDVKNRLAKFERGAKISKTTGETITSSFVQQKHPVSTLEVQLWLENNNFDIMKKYGNWRRDDYNDVSPRAIFWARKRNKKI